MQCLAGHCKVAIRKCSALNFLISWDYWQGWVSEVQAGDLSPLQINASQLWVRQCFRGHAVKPMFDRGLVDLVGKSRH